MKTILFSILFSSLASCSFERNEKGNMPSFNLLMLDSSTIINSREIPEGKPVMVIFFSTDCTHCQDETAILLKNINSVKNVKIYYVSNDSMDQLRVFNRYYKMEKYSNITIGRDYTNTLTQYFKIRSTPYIIIYNKKKELIKVFDTDNDMTQIIKEINNPGRII